MHVNAMLLYLATCWGVGYLVGHHPGTSHCTCAHIPLLPLLLLLKDHEAHMPQHCHYYNNGVQLLAFSAVSATHKILL